MGRSVDGLHRPQLLPRNPNGARPIDRATKGALAVRALNIDVNPLTIARAGRKRIDAFLVNGHPIGDSQLLPDPFVQAGQCKFTHMRLPEIRPQEGQTVIGAPYFVAQLLSDRRRSHRRAIS